jgi:hypothetical protein
MRRSLTCCHDLPGSLGGPLLRPHVRHYTQLVSTTSLRTASFGQGILQDCGTASHVRVRTDVFRYLRLLDYGSLYA